ncbi:ABC transporter-like protein 12, partial [Dinothrombium tinctorium]
MDEEHISLVSSRKSSKVSLVWENLSYVVKYRKWSKLASFNLTKALVLRNKVILQPQSGHLETGCLMAIMGKSGSGKSTLIECLSGRRSKGLSGKIFIASSSICGCSMNSNQMKIAFLPQNDCLINTLTVQESVIYASKLKNYKLNNSEHKKICENLLAQLSLEQCRDVRTLNCSGGQRKRISVATELVSKPTILILDEPTSGLDSYSAIQCIQMLKSLTETIKNPLGIIVTIHQPSSKVLDEFHRLYLLSHNGKRIYDGSPKEILAFFANFNLHCPQFYNPGDFAIEVASADYGNEILDELESFHAKNIEIFDRERKLSEVISSMKNHSLLAFIAHILILTKRTTLTTFRDPVLNLLRLIIHFIVGFVIIALFGTRVGEESGCLTIQQNSLNLSLKDIREQQMNVAQNLGFIVFTFMFLLYANMTTVVLAFPSEVRVLIKERTNGWYSCLSYYLAKTIADLPFVFVMTTIYSIATYYLTGQVDTFWRFTVYWFATIAIAYIGQSIGLMVGIIFVDNMSAAVFIGPVLCIPFILLSGFFVKVDKVPFYLKPIAFSSFVRYAFEAAVIGVYGFNRCDEVYNAIHLQKLRKRITPQVIFQFATYLNRLNLTYRNTRPILEALALDQNQSLAELNYFDEYFEDFDISDLNV